MEYYRLTNATERKKVGRFYQTTGCADGYNLDASNAMSNLNDEEFPNFIPDLRFDLEDKAKLTDIISTANIMARGFLINEKVKTIFESCKLPVHKYYDATINVKGVMFPYYWLHLLYNDLDSVDFVNSSFYKSHFIDKIENVSITNIEDYFVKSSSGTDDVIFVFAEKIKLLSTFERFDMILFPYIFKIGLRYLVSFDLKEKLEKEKVTGIDIEPQDILLPY